jgi:hypothetical protein
MGVALVIVIRLVEMFELKCLSRWRGTIGVALVSVIRLVEPLLNTHCSQSAQTFGSDLIETT